MKSITQDMRFRQSLMRYAEKYGVTRASGKYNKSPSYIYFWRVRWDGSQESLRPQSRRPHHHPNEHTEGELKLIKDMRRRDLVPTAPNPEPVRTPEPEKVSEKMVAHLTAMASNGTTDRERCLASLLLKLAHKGVNPFTTNDIDAEQLLSKSARASLIRTAINLGLIWDEACSGKKKLHSYHFHTVPLTDIRSKGLTIGQCTLLSKLYIAFRSHHFTMHDGAWVCGLRYNGFAFHANTFTERGILTAEKYAGMPATYMLSVTPHDHPECFTGEIVSGSCHASGTASSTASRPTATVSI